MQLNRTGQEMTDTNIWEDNFQHMKKFVNIGTLPSPYGNLGKWVANQRKLYRDKELEQYKIEKLESLSIWYWIDRNDVWNKKLSNLTNYVCDKNSFPNADSVLGKWVEEQYRKYRNRTISRTRLNLLNDNPIWVWPVETRYKVWKRWFNKLTYYIENNCGYPSDNSSLNLWITIQRKHYKKCKLSLKRINKLEMITGWEWEDDCGYVEGVGYILTL